MKKRRLNKRGKILFTTIAIVVDLLVYYLLTRYGIKASDNEGIFIIGWLFMLFEPMIAIEFIWG